jgi:hypothetical protein
MKTICPYRQLPNLGGYEDMLYRIIYFPFVYQLIQNPNIVINDQHDTSVVKAQFIIYDQYGARFVELKLRQETDSNPNFFVPVSFSALRKVRGRTHVKIMSKNILEYNDGYPLR